MECVVKPPQSPIVVKKSPFEKLKAKVTYTKVAPPLYESAQATHEINLSHALVLTAKHITARLCRDLDPATTQGENYFPMGEMTPESTAEQVIRQIEAVRQCEKAVTHITQLTSAFEKRVRVSVLRGFNEAYTLLDSVGALALGGVRTDVDKTRDLILASLVLGEESESQQAESKKERSTAVSNFQMLWARE